MNILLIGNPIIVNTIRSPREDIRIYVPSLDFSLLSVENVAEDIIDHYPVDLFIIESHLQIGNSALSENAGIKLLKLLRLHHIHSHVVLYSWLNREMLMGNIRNAIVFSKGVSFNRLPEFLNDIQGIDFERLAQETADEGELLQLFRAEYNPDDRHFNANKFGVWHLMRVHDAYEKMNGGKSDLPCDDILRRNINDYLNSYTGKLLQFISGKQTENLEERIQKLTKIYDEKARIDKLKHAEDSINALDEEIKNCTIRIEAVKALEEAYTNKNMTGGGYFQKKAQAVANEQMMETIHEEIREYEERVNDLKKGREHFVIIKHWAELPPNASSSANIDTSKFDNGTIKSIKEALGESKPHIVYVDDMAEEGWGDILQRIVYKDKADYEKMEYIVPAKSDSIKVIADKIIQIKNPDLIILDLRLKDERGYLDPADLSGFQVLQELNKRHLGCAILVLTASNKVWSLKEAFRGNVMSYWTKSGIGADETEDSVNNYLDLICQIKYLTDYSWVFRLLAELENTKIKIENSQTAFWWETKKLAYTKATNTYHRIPTPKESIIKLLTDAVQTALSDMRQMFFFDHSDATRGLMLHTLTLRVSDILEKIHFYNERDDDYIPLAARMNIHKDKPLQTRNISAHSGFIEPKNEDIEKFVSFVLVYVLNEPKELLYKTTINIPTPQTKVEKSILNKSKNITETEGGISLKDNESVTPIAERMGLLQTGQTIKVEVVSIEPYNNLCYFYHFYNSQTYKTSSAPLYNDNPSHRKFIDNIAKGDLIDVCQNGVTNNGKPRYTITHYYKISTSPQQENCISDNTQEQ